MLYPTPARPSQKLATLDDLNQSSLILYNLLAGNMPHVMPGSVGFVDVVDVARSHVLAAQVALLILWNAVL
jgi:hypothetical protein